MNETARNNTELIAEIFFLKQRIQELEQSVAERKQAEIELRELEEKYRSLASTVDSLILVDRNCRYLFANENYMDRFGPIRESVFGRKYDEFHGEETSRIFADAVKYVYDTGNPYQDEWMGRRSGNCSLRTFSPVKSPDGTITAVTVAAKDITDRKRVEKALRESDERYRHIVETSLEGIWILNEELQITFVNKRLADMLGYAPEEMLGRRVDSFIFEEDLADHASRVDARRRGVGEIFERRFRRKDGTAIWSIISATALLDDEGRYTGSFSMFTDITDRKKAEEQLQHTLGSLRKAVNTTIQAMVSAVETRDPYTAGHQIRSANLARAIATEMGLSPEKVEGIRMAGSIHDIGKLSIPAEILSKPTKLSETEFSLIKEHARQGYEILKNVESPWPLAEIVYQHHERMDGSGYPRQLKGDEICIEARIIAVSDVVESMASHRPYRPGLGIHPALEEIEKNSGTLYDNTVADACLRLFREKGFQLEGT